MHATYSVLLSIVAVKSIVRVFNGDRQVNAWVRDNGKDRRRHVLYRIQRSTYSALYVVLSGRDRAATFVTSALALMS